MNKNAKHYISLGWNKQTPLRSNWTQTKKHTTPYRTAAPLHNWQTTWNINVFMQLHSEMFIRAYYAEKNNNEATLMVISLCVYPGVCRFWFSLGSIVLWRWTCAHYYHRGLDAKNRIRIWIGVFCVCRAHVSLSFEWPIVLHGENVSQWIPVFKPSFRSPHIHTMEKTWKKTRKIGAMAQARQFKHSKFKFSY